MPPAAADRTITRPGSIAHRIAMLVLHAGEERGHGLMVSEAREAYIQEYGDSPATFDAQFFSLARRGLFVRADGRTSRTRYVHRDSVLARRLSDRRLTDGVPEGDLDDDARKVLRALGVATERLGRMVSTREVTTTLRDLGLRLQSTDINAVRARLMTLERRRTRGNAAWAEPQVESMDAPTLAGRKSRRWKPVGSSVGLEPSAATAAEAIRAVVHHVQSRLARPVMRREIVWWLAAHVDHPLAAALRTHLDATGSRWSIAGLLSYVSAADARIEAPDGRLQRIALDFACWGGSPGRYWVGAINDDALRCSALDEWAVGLRVADEVDRLLTLDARWRRDAALHALVVARATTLARHIERHVGDRVACCVAMDTIVAGYARVAEWAAAAHGTNGTDASHDARVARRAEIDSRRRHVLAVAHVWDDLAGVRREEEPEWIAIGAASAVLPEAIAPFIAAAVLETETPEPVVRRAILRDVRRVPLRPPRTSEFGPAPVRADVGVDRADALLRVFHLSPAPRTQALLDAADDLLGPVLRDAGPLRRILDAPACDPRIQRAAVVALALIGAPVACDVARLARSTDIADLRTALLSSVIVGNGALDQAAHDATRTAGPSLAVAVMRIANRRLLTALG